MTMLLRSGPASSAAAAVYIALMSAWVYGVFERDAYYDWWWWVPLVLMLHFGVGYAIGRWWAVGLAAALPLVAIPAGDAEHGDTPVYALMLLFAVGFAALLAVGVGFAACERDRRSLTHSPRGCATFDRLQALKNPAESGAFL